MTCAKWLAILICILPTFSKGLDVLSFTFPIKSCSIQDSDGNKIEDLPLGRCVTLFGDKITATFEYSNVGDEGQSNMIVSQIVILLPHIFFLLFLLTWITNQKYIVWLKAARIAPLTSQKRCRTCLNWMLLILLLLLMLLNAAGVFFASL